MAESDQTSRASNQSVEYDLFLSYSTDPDYAFARRLEVFLRIFHRRAVLNRRQLPELRVFLGSSSLLRRPHGDRPEQIGEMLDERLAISERIRVLCSPQAVRSEHVPYEIGWYLNGNKSGPVWLAVTEGEDRASRPDRYFSAAIRDAGITTRPWFDFRGYRKAASDSQTVRAFDRERVRLVSDLVGVPVEHLYPEWLEPTGGDATSQPNELLHLIVPNHGKLFKSMTNAYLPGWERRVESRINGICGSHELRTCIRRER